MLLCLWLHIRTACCSSPGQSEAGDTETETGVDTDGHPYRGRATHPTAGEAEGEDRQESQPAPRHHDQRLRGVLETKHGSKDTVLPAELLEIISAIYIQFSSAVPIAWRI